MAPMARVIYFYGTYLYALYSFLVLLFFETQAWHGVYRK